MPRRTIVKVYPQYDDKTTFVESPTQRNFPERSSTSTTLNYNEVQGEPDPWISGKSAYQYPVPKTGDPWETCIDKVRAYDGGMCDGWREEIQNLLIFAGLFSAAVTAFVIESYQQLSQDPSDVTNWLLQQLLIETHNANTENSAARNTTLPPLPTFSPSMSGIRINVFWFMSLSLSLATVLIGILCTQWLREYEREAPLDPKEAIPLRQLRYEGLIKWRVPKIVSMLPVMLHTSLVLFFAGLIDLLWSLNLTVAIFVSIISGLLLFVVVATTVLPTLQMLITKDMRLRTPQCPFKSAQSWTMHRFVTFIIKLIPETIDLKKVPRSFFARYSPFFDDNDWVDFDIRWRDARAKSSRVTSPKEIQRDHAKSDLVQGLIWIDKNLGQNTEMIYAIYHCLRELPLDQAIPSIVQLDDTVKHHLISPTDHTISYPTHRTSKNERVDMLSALFLELNTHAFPQLDQFQLEAIIRNINSRLDWRARHTNSTQDASMSKCLPFVRWPLFSVRRVPADIATQFLLCMKNLVVNNQTDAQIDDRIWELVGQVISHPSIEEHDSQHDLHSKIAFDIMLAYEHELPSTDGTEDDLERRKFKDKIKTCVQHVIRAFPPGEVQGLSGEPRKHAKAVISAVKRRMDNMGGVNEILQNPDDKTRWSKIVKVMDGGDVSLEPDSGYLSGTWDTQSSPL